MLKNDIIMLDNYYEAARDINLKLPPEVLDKSIIEALGVSEAASMFEGELAKIIAVRVDPVLKTGRKAMRALEDLTSGGSEFVGNVDRCVAFIRSRLDTTIKLAEENKRLREELKELKEKH